jgi:hypothetical protein
MTLRWRTATFVNQDRLCAIHLRSVGLKNVLTKDGFLEQMEEV